MSDSPKPPKMNVVDLLLAFVGPAVLGKSLVLYFGAHYSASPGDGYGIGLVLSILFTTTMIGRFIWKYRNLPFPSGSSDDKS